VKEIVYEVRVKTDEAINVDFDTEDIKSGIESALARDLATNKIQNYLVTEIKCLESLWGG